jgi:acyl carrier protein
MRRSAMAREPGARTRAEARPREWADRRIQVGWGRMQTADDVLEQVRSALVELFEVEPERVTLEARLNEDLEIDSIDAVDLLDRLRRLTGRKISADDFRSVRTVGDLVTAVHAVLQA